MYPNNHQSYINRNFLNDENLKIGYSQNGEDDVIRTFFWEKIIKRELGIYIDIGCFREDIYSNTKLLNLIGWRGIAIDANPDLLEPWLEARTHDIFINKCIRRSIDRFSYMNFYRFEPRTISTSNKDRAKYLISKGLELKDVIKIKSITLKELAIEIKNKIEDNIDFISIDIEYINYLDDLPEFIENLSPKLICMEVVESEVTIINLMSSREVKTMNKLKYKPISLTGDNIFFARNI